MGSCLMLSGLICLVFAFLAAAVGFAAPYWLDFNGSKTKFLWATCTGDNCEWFFENNFDVESGQPDWIKATQALYGLGLLTLLIAFIIGCIHMCSGCCREVASTIHAIAGLLIFAFLELGVAIALFGAKANEMENADVSGDGTKFAWGFWVAIGGAGMSLIAALLYTCAGCRARYEGYTRGDVV